MIDFHSHGGADKFLITGCQRSGTTLMAIALDAHPTIEIVEENNALFHVQGALTRQLDLKAASARAANNGRMIGFKAPRDSHRLNEVLEVLPLIRVVWIEREIRQTVASMLSLGADISWAAEFAPREIRKYIFKTNDMKAQRLFALANELADSRARSVAFASLCWMIKREQRYAATRLLGSRAMLVDYEDLTTDPESALRGVLDFLGLPWSLTVLDHPGRIERGTRPGGSDPARPIDTSSLFKWREQLSDGDLRVLASVKCGFEVDDELSLTSQSAPC
jgi:hypothetical protein